MLVHLWGLLSQQSAWGMGCPVYVHFFPFPLIIYHFSGSHFHAGIFTSDAIAINKNIDCLLSSFEAPYPCYLMESWHPLCKGVLIIIII